MKTILDTTRELAACTYNDYLAEAEKQGRGVLGYLCSYLPEEIIHAAGFIPYRMRAVGSEGTTRADAYYSSINCSYIKRCFDKVLAGDYDFLRGVVFLNGCDHSRRMYDNWRFAKGEEKFLHMFFVPHVLRSAAYEQFVLECQKLVAALETHFGVKVTPEALRSSIALYNQKRRLLAEIYALRKKREVPIKASELLTVMLAVTAVPVENALETLTEVKKFILARVASKPDDIRLFISSGCIEEPEHLELIENCGAAIVGDNICLGTRHFEGEVSEAGDPLRALAERYLGHLSCPRMMGDFDRRFDFIQRMKAEYGFEGVIIEKLKFCDLWGGEIYLHRVEAKKRGIPLLALERELYGGGQGQIRTRVQAFLEKLRNHQLVDEGMLQAAGSDYKPKL
ncbi:MAG: 2-hydroxyacyl-CoA dehydratase family protein [Smithellaceae bacterium]|nr:2-hydroxyacyl-CoA dehydratase family protein [Smithellaceae bacterium]